MLDENDVNQEQESSPVQEEAVTQPGTEQVTESATVEENQISQEVGQPQIQPVSAVDDTGVPWKNRYYEMQRKQEDLLNNLETKIGEVISTKIGQTQQKQYSSSELRMFIAQTDNPAHKAWAEEELDKINKAEQAELIRTEISKVTKSREEETIKEKSIQSVAQMLPECFKLDSFGNKQWDISNPITQQIAEIMKYPEFANNPRGIIAAAEIAYGRVARMNLAKTQTTARTLAKDVKKLQKKTLVEGSGVPQVKTTKNPLEEARARLRQKPTDKSAANDAVRAYLEKYTFTER